MISMRKTGAAALAAAVVFWTPALAGNDNTLFILQDSASGGIGNTLFVDQSQADGSTVAGDRFGTTPATQQGFGNTANVTLTDELASVVLFQNNPATSGSVTDVNRATLSGGALSTIILYQDGIGNIGAIDVNGQGSTGSLSQIGNNNNGSVSVLGSNATGELFQQGNNNDLGVEVRGAGTSVTYTLIGNNVTPATQPVVVSNGGTVTITQTSN